MNRFPCKCLWCDDEVICYGIFRTKDDQPIAIIEDKDGDIHTVHLDSYASLRLMK